MAAAYRDSIANVASGTSISVDPASHGGGLTYSSGDVLVLHVYGYTTIADPSGSDLTWTNIASATATDVGPFAVTILHKVWWAVADAAITSFTLAHGENDQYGYVLTSISGADTTTPVDVASSANGDTVSTTSVVAPSISPAGSDSLLLCAAGNWPSSGGGTWTVPSGMTEREDFASWDYYALATLGLSASGATGTKTFTLTNDSGNWLASSIAIKSASGGGGGGEGSIAWYRA